MPTIARVGMVVTAAMTALMAWAPAASAHTAFESSDPADGSDFDADYFDAVADARLALIRECLYARLTAVAGFVASSPSWASLKIMDSEAWRGP